MNFGVTYSVFLSESSERVTVEKVVVDYALFPNGKCCNSLTKYTQFRVTVKVIFRVVRCCKIFTKVIAQRKRSVPLLLPTEITLMVAAALIGTVNFFTPCYLCSVLKAERFFLFLFIRQDLRSKYLRLFQPQTVTVSLSMFLLYIKYIIM